MFTNNFRPRETIAYSLGCVASAKSFKPSLSAVYDGISVSSSFQKLDGLMKNYATKSFITKATSSSTTGASGVCFGDGTTPPTAEDVCLSGNHHTWITSTNTIVEFGYLTDDNGDVGMTAVYTITNTQTEDKTIAEVGLAQQGSFYNGGYNYYLPVLVERTLLETPITIPAGGVGKVTYTLRLSGLPER